LIVKGGAFATVGLINATINVHAMTSTMSHTKVVIVAILGHLPVSKYRVLIRWLRALSWHNVDTCVLAIHIADGGLQILKPGRQNFQANFSTGDNKEKK
jgi:hypothetical protein